MVREFGYSAILGWSVSRYDQFHICKRQYYYNYYAKHDLEFPRKKIDRLKSLTSTALEIGTIVHEVISVLLRRLLKTEEPINTAKFLNYAKKLTEENCDYKDFSEVYYQIVPKIDKTALFTSVEQSLSNFLKSERFEWLVTKAVNNKKDWVIEPPGYGETRIKGMKAYCKVDFLFPVDDRIYILDWKTGKQDMLKHKKQLLGYVCWASYHFSRETNEIIPIISYLQPSYNELEMKFKDTDIEAFAEQIKNETAEMYSFCKDVENNIPLDKDKFEKTSNSKICHFCNFRELC